MSDLSAPVPVLIGVYDALEDGRPNFGDRERIAVGAERTAISNYLRSAEILLRTTGLTEDLIEPQRGRVVPLSFRTDGRWIWTDPVLYYLETYGIAPARGLTEYIRGRDYRYAEPSQESLSAAHDALEAYLAALPDARRPAETREDTVVSGGVPLRRPTSEFRGAGDSRGDRPSR